MTLKLSFGGTTFNLVISSPEINASLVSTKFIPNTNNGVDRDAVIDLKEFTGKLYISHASNNENIEVNLEDPKSILCQNRESENKIYDRERTYDSNEISDVDRESAIARAKERFDDFDENLDRLFIINGEEWFGRINPLPIDVTSENFINSWQENDISPEASYEKESKEYMSQSMIPLASINERNEVLEVFESQGPEFLDSETGFSVKNYSTLSSSTSKADHRDSVLSNTSTIIAGNLNNSKLNFGSQKQISNGNTINYPSLDNKSSLKVQVIDQQSISTSSDSDMENPSLARSLDSYSPDPSEKGILIDSETNIKKEYGYFHAEIHSDSSDFSSVPSYAGTSGVVNARNLRRETRLHRACNSFKTKVKDLNHLLKLEPKAASTFDDSGRLPLHVIACNEYLLFGREGEGAQLFIDDLVKEYPDAIITRDDNDLIPFSKSINDWISEVHRQCHETEYFNSNTESKETSIPKIVITDPLMEWSFKMLSEMFTRLESDFSHKMGSRAVSLARIHSPGQQFLEEISCVSSLMKTCLLIGEDSLRCRIFAYSFMKRLLLRKKMVGNWLVVMLANAETSPRAIEYFEEVSNLTASDALGIPKPKTTDIAEFHHLLEDLIVEISQFDYILPALFLLDEQNMKRACSTYAIRRILELSMLDPSLLGLLIFDLDLHILLIVAYHSLGFIYLRPHHQSLVESLFCTPFLFTTIICIYLLVREEGSHYVLIRSCKKQFKGLDIWDVMGLMAIFCVLATNIAMLISIKMTPIWLFAVTKLLVWLKLLGFLKGINLHLTMFIKSLGKILAGMRWFLVVTSVTILAFADMMHLAIYTVPGVCSDVDVNDKGLIADYCSDTLLRNTLRAYSTFVGDVGLDDYRITPVITLLWSVYMFVGVLMLLNVLIAIMTDCYNSSFSQRFSLLGRARIPVLAKHSYLDTATRKISETGCSRKYCIVIGIILFYILFAISFVILLRSFILSIDELESRINMYIMLGVCTGLFFIASLSLVIVVKDFFHINLGGSERYLSKWMIQPFMPLVYSLLGISEKSEDFLAKENESGKDDILPAVKELIEKSELRIRQEFRHQLKKERKDMLRSAKSKDTVPTLE